MICITVTEKRAAAMIGVTVVTSHKSN